MGHIEATIDGLEETINRLKPISENDGVELADALGALGVRQTQRRLQSEKTSPSGAAWKPNARGGSLLQLTGALTTSIAHTAAPWAATWGSSLVYAAIHNFGGAIKAKNKKALHFRVGKNWATVAQVVMPQRQFIGISEANGQEMIRLAETYFTGKFG